MTAYADDADCGRCGKPVHLPHDPPCPHGYAACPECGWGAVCTDCRREEIQDMFRDGGEWSPDADPFFDPAARETDAAYWASGPREDPHSPGSFRWPAGEEKQA